MTVAEIKAAPRKSRGDLMTTGTKEAESNIPPLDFWLWVYEHFNTLVEEYKLRGKFLSIQEIQKEANRNE